VVGRHRDARDLHAISGNRHAISFTVTRSSTV
jgi:hypothetical protein